MDCDACCLKLFTKSELVRFIQKIGHYQAARIIEEHNIDGSKVLELTQKDIVGWHLTEVEEELLLKCIYQIKLNHITENHCQRLIQRNHRPPLKLQRRPTSKKYFKYTKRDKQDDPLLSKSLSSTTLGSETEIYDEYIVVSSSEKRNTIVRRIKKYLTFPFSKTSRYEDLKNSGVSYIELNDVATTPNSVGPPNREVSHIYEEAPTLKKKKTTSVKCSIKLCCFSYACSRNYYSD